MKIHGRSVQDPVQTAVKPAGPRGPHCGRVEPQGGVAAAPVQGRAGPLAALPPSPHSAELPANAGVEPAVDDRVDEDGGEGEEETQGVGQAETAGGREDFGVEVGHDVDDGDGQPLHVEGDGDNGEEHEVLPVARQLLPARLAVSAQVHARAQKATDEEVEGHDGGGGEGVLEEEDEDGVGAQETLAFPVLHAQRQQHLLPTRQVSHVLQAVHDGDGRGQGQGQEPNGGDDQASQALAVRLEAGGRAHDGAVAVHGDGQDGEDGHEDVGQLQEGAHPTQHLPQRPVLQGQAEEDEGRAEDAGEDVGQHQVEDVPEARRAEVAVTTQRGGHQRVA